MPAEKKRPSKKLRPDDASRGLAGALPRSRIFKDYEDAFTKASGLPLALREPLAERNRRPWSDHNGFCALMARNDAGCAACYELQCRLEKEARTRPRTLQCFAGICETAVPVRIGDKVLAFLETGHVFLHKPARGGFNRVAREILKWGASVDLKRAEDAWLATRVISPEQYDGFVRMLSIFARHLELCGNSLALESTSSGGQAIRTARAFIAGHSQDDLSLKAVADAVNLSAHYFCKRFKQATGMAFTQYVSRVRVESARQMLADPALRISEVAFKAGFQSVSQFNRAFLRFAGRSPRDYRRELVVP